MRRVRGAAYWLAPPLLCLLLHWRGFTSWFHADDFAWLSLNLDVYSFQDLIKALFGPGAQGTWRPLSERVFFMAGHALFGLNPLPFRIVVFLTQFANMGLVMWIGDRLAGRRGAGLAAALLWMSNGAMLYPLSWASAYNQVMCGFFLLLALFFLMRHVETGERRYYIWQWAAFLAGFGAMETNLVYPAIAAGYAWLFARKYLVRTLPLFAVSAAYVVAHLAMAPAQKGGVYAMHFTGAMLKTLGTYWTWSAGPTFLWSPFELPSWLLPAGVAIVSAAILLFFAAKVRAGRRASLFCALWYLATLAPILPLRDHVTEYYIYLPLIGFCWLAGWALVECWASGTRLRIVATAVAAAYAFMILPQTVDASGWYKQMTVRSRNLVQGVARARELHPGKTILLFGVDSQLFGASIRNGPFRLIGVRDVYLAPGTESRIETPSEPGVAARYAMPAQAVSKALDSDQAVVYDVTGPRLRNITSLYASMPRETGLPRRVDAASPLTSYLLGPEWYGSDGDHRWMPGRATVRLGPPANGQRLHLNASCASEQLAEGPLTVAVSVNGMRLPPATVRSCDAFELSFPLPPSSFGASETKVTVEVDHTITPPSDPRELGLAFGVIELR